MIFDQPKIIFLGTPEFAVPILEKLISSEFPPLLVVTQPDRPVGRRQTVTPPPVKVAAQAHGIPVIQPENKSALVAALAKEQFDLAILVAYGMIIPQALLDQPKLGFINVHPSQLPKYRGPSPIQAALLAGETSTGLTIIKLSQETDAGPIVAQQTMVIELRDTFQSLSQKLSALGAELLTSVLPEYLAGSSKLVEQDHSGASYCQMITRQSGQIDWSASALAISRQFRAFYPWPGVFTNLNGQRLKILNLELLEGDFEPGMAPGVVFLTKKQQLAVTCGSGVIVLATVQLAGKKSVSGVDFILGQKNLVGQKLG